MNHISPSKEENHNNSDSSSVLNKITGLLAIICGSRKTMKMATENGIFNANVQIKLNSIKFISKCWSFLRTLSHKPQNFFLSNYKCSACDCVLQTNTIKYDT